MHAPMRHDDSDLPSHRTYALCRLLLSPSNAAYILCRLYGEDQVA